ncbi:hypothetical protein [Gymnodinialimonas sp.]
MRIIPIDAFFLLHDPSPNSGYFTKWFPEEADDVSYKRRALIEERLSSGLEEKDNKDWPNIAIRSMDGRALEFEMVSRHSKLQDEKGRQGISFSIYLLCRVPGDATFGAAIEFISSAADAYLKQARENHIEILNSQGRSRSLYPGYTKKFEKYKAAMYELPKLFLRSLSLDAKVEGDPPEMDAEFIDRLMQDANFRSGILEIVGGRGRSRFR